MKDMSNPSESEQLLTTMEVARLLFPESNATADALKKRVLRMRKESKLPLWLKGTREYVITLGQLRKWQMDRVKQNWS